MQRKADIFKLSRFSSSVAHIKVLVRRMVEHRFTCIWHRGSAIGKLFKYNANVNARDSHKATPLHCAVEGGQLEVFQVLLECSAHRKP